MQTLDTGTLPRRERGDAIITLLREIAFANRVTLEDPANAFMATDSFALGPLQLVHLKRSGVVLEVDRERDDCAPMLAMMLGTRAAAVREQFGHVVQQRAGVVDMVELHRPHRTSSQSNPGGWVLKIPAEALGLPASVVTRARPALVDSPLQRLYARHLAMLAELAPELEDPTSKVGAARADLAAATIALSRAVLSVAAGDDRTARESMAASLVPRVQVFVREHLRDPDLSPEMIASAHHVSVRLLYRALADVGVHLEQWVIEERLSGARDDLAAPQPRYSSIAATARAWGFSNPSFFSARFRAAFGVTPRQWHAATRPSQPD
ncbi:helix-turn-helix domain-containing protein [Cellulomonas palmilytica]|uniref:helix-turn-helix domain-containing protein n=1 Tax=Cellulomonas palmilytica TaxID=2608402 RepID=UPI001F298348|nr:helix-turn-helix domain-containing protein [Cellulomonas palmilytica]UJP40004.1 helix-turn-helix domain-containing protein [Cellulomonas palmilytica]